jgi:hypothetical protein
MSIKYRFEFNYATRKGTVWKSVPSRSLLFIGIKEWAKLAEGTFIGESKDAKDRAKAWADKLIQEDADQEGRRDLHWYHTNGAEDLGW